MNKKRSNPQTSGPEAHTPGGRRGDEDAASRDPSGVNNHRAEEALRAAGEARRIRRTPPVDMLAGIQERCQAQALEERAETLLEPGPLTIGNGEAVPSLGVAEPFEGSRHSIIDTLERPTTVSVRASEQRLQLLHSAGVLQAGIDTATSMKARGTVEKMLCHQLAASHAAAMNLLALLPNMGKNSGNSWPVADVGRVGNAAARLLDAYAAGVQALVRLKAGGTQRVIVQHQQLVVAQGDAVMVPSGVETPNRGAASRRVRKTGAPAGRVVENDR